MRPHIVHTLVALLAFALLSTPSADAQPSVEPDPNTAPASIDTPTSDAAMDRSQGEPQRANDNEPPPPLPGVPQDTAQRSSEGQPPQADERVAEGEVSAATTSAAETASARPLRPTTMDDVAQGSVQELHFGRTKARYSLNFFGDLSFAMYSPSGPDRHPSFELGAQNLLLRGELGGHLVATTEFALGFGEGSMAGVDLERLHIRWQDEHFFIEAGRTHTDLGYWNNAYHHGRWLQPSIERPRWVRFEDEAGLLPVHWIGLSGGASTELGPGKLRMTLSVGNNRGKIADDIRNRSDYVGPKALHAMLEYIGLGLPDLRVGISGIYDRIAAQPDSVRPLLPNRALDEWIASVHVAYPSVPFLVITEAYLIEHHASNHVWRTYGGFVLLGYVIDVLTPYLECGRILSSGGTDPFFIPDPAAAGTTSVDAFDLIVGLRLDLSPWSALKFEYQYSHMQAAGASHTGIANWSWGF